MEIMECPNFDKFAGFRKAINKLEKTGLLIDEINELRYSAIFTTNKDKISLNINEASPLKAKLDYLINLVGSLSKSFKEITGETNENSISIKLPNVEPVTDDYTRPMEYIP
ncbi:hypothetical protein [Cognatitamlana onchidii]|uniref:hypothetical protein n=1 Tax=Cognatitamlana onchidii TaxID=2562860 RepID=UPI0010A5C776|nr:hypothetical protein [Algibacter onchidii]